MLKSSQELGLTKEKDVLVEIKQATAFTRDGRRPLAHAGDSFENYTAVILRSTRN
jgi:hypothetical protein